MTTVVLYHANCYDGFGAAWAAREAMLPEHIVAREDLIFVPARYEDDFIPEKAFQGNEVFLLDFTFKVPYLFNLTTRTGRTTIIDHHQSAEKDLKYLHRDHPRESHNIHTIFDMEHSGAVLTWNYFFPDDDPPELLRYIEDRDLWRKALPGTDEVASALRMYPMDFDVWDGLMDENGVGRLRAEGDLILKFTNQTVSNICDGAYMYNIGGWEIPVVNTSAFWSEIGHELLGRYPEAKFVGSYTMMDEKRRKWSLRSEDHRQDVSLVAVELGKRLGTKPGGGHRNAAGFVEILP